VEVGSLPRKPHYWSSWWIQWLGFTDITRDISAFKRDFPRRYRPAKVPERLLPPA
jgi:hypothetical protein